MSTYTTPVDEFDTSSSDGSLGGEVQFDRDRPPLGSFVFGPAYDGTCFIIKDNLLYFSKPKQPEAWPSLYYIEVGPRQLPGKTGLFYNGQPYYLNENEIWHIQGTGQGLFQPIPTNAKTGAQSIRGAVAIAGRGIFHTGPDGIYVYANGADTKITEDLLEPIFRGEDKNGLPGVSSMSNSWLFAYKNYLYFGYASATAEDPKNIIALNLQTNQASYYIYNDGSDVQIRSLAVDSTNSRILVGDSLGHVRVIESGTDDSGTAISWEVESKDFTMPTRRYFPRFVKYDVDTTSGTGSLVLDGTVHQTHSLTTSRDTKRRLVGEGNGNRVSIRIAGTGPATIHAAEFE